MDVYIVVVYLILDSPFRKNNINISKYQANISKKTLCFPSSFYVDNFILDDDCAFLQFEKLFSQKTLQVLVERVKMHIKVHSISIQVVKCFSLCFLFKHRRCQAVYKLCLFSLNGYFVRIYTNVACKCFLSTIVSFKCLIIIKPDNGIP